MLIVILHWPFDSDRGQEVIGPFGSEQERNKWIDEIKAAGEAEDGLLQGVHFILTHLEEPFQVQR